MEDKKDKLLLVMGIIYLVFWLSDFFYNAVFRNDYSWLLWYSSAGFLITGIALVTQNTKLIYSMFCALFVVEILWIVDLFYVLVSHHTLFGFTEYFLSPSFHAKDLYFTLYHALIPSGLLIAVLRLKKTYAYGWVGAIIYAFILVFLTYFFLGPESQVNCVHSINQCRTIFSFLYKIDNPYRIFVGLLCLILFAYIPSNYFLLLLKNKNKTG